MLMSDTHGPFPMQDGSGRPQTAPGYHPERKLRNDPIRGYKPAQDSPAYGLSVDGKNADNRQYLARDRDSQAIGKHVKQYQGERSALGVPRNYIPLPAGRQYLRDSYAYMNGAGRPLELEWMGSVGKTRLQPTEFNSEGDAQDWRRAEWRRQKSRRRFSHFTVIDKRFATSEGAQAGVQQKQFRHPSSEKRFYAFIRAMSANFGTLE